ncbi:MAG: hypothetical protein KDA78_09620 [Planctomycetaceae bacterium]|nr:hypothetical protein [Planctomycetaceae bacterium]
MNCLLDEPADSLPNRLSKPQGEPDRALWKEYYAQSPDTEQTRQIIQQLQKKDLYDHIVVALEEALRSGQTEPWMYEVLALAMKIKGYPADQVERILVSMTDFNARDVPNLLGSAAYLMRLGADQPALRLYRQVSRLEPTRPEPYLWGRKLADRLQDLDAVIWSNTGILTYYWFAEYQQQHEKSVQMLQDWKLRLQQQGNPEQVAAIDRALQKALVRDFQLKLSWSGNADLDLIVEEPLGTRCSFSEPHTISGGALVHEGAGPNQAECYEQYIAAYAAPGDYIITAQHASGTIVGNRARLEVIRYAGTEHEQRDQVNIVFDRAAKKLKISLNEGRRTETAPIFQPLSQTQKQRKQDVARTLQQFRSEAAVAHNPLAQLQAPSPVGVGYSPVVAPVSSGVQLNAGAIVSPDRRYVRIGVQPSITSVTDVFTFTFAGSGSGN